MPEATLARRAGVELVRTGSWAISSGDWNPTRADILAAVEAMQCPAIKPPRIKLGHVDARFDGEPAMGFYENLRTTDGGHTLIADQVALSWLDSVQAAAYPERSVEGNYRHRCGLNHVHPFVITAVALLGVTSPGVSTLRSLADLPDMLGVAASEEVPDGAQHVQVTIRAAAGVHTGAMVALIPTAEDAARLAVEGGEPEAELHVTLAYLGEAADLGAQGQQDVIDAVSSAVNGLPVFDADCFALSVFNPPGVTSGDGKDRSTCIVLGLSGDMIDAVHDFVEQSLTPEQVASQHRPWAAHSTLVYTDDLSKLAALTDRIGPVTFDRVRLAFGDQIIDIPLIDQPIEDVPNDDPVYAAAAGNPEALHAFWTANPKGLAKWRDKPHPWTALFHHLRKYLNVDEAKRTASKWFLEVTGHIPNQHNVTAAQVGLFDEQKHPRAHNGKWTSGGPGGLKQDDKLASRITLGPGETLAGSSTIPSAGIALAAVDSSAGRKLRLGLNINEEDLGRWSGADKGSTVVLDEQGITSLDAVIPQMLSAGKDGKTALKVFDQRDRDLNGQVQALLNKQYPNLSKPQAKELAAGDRAQAERVNTLAHRQGIQDERLARVPDPADRKRIAAIDVEVRQAVGDPARVAVLRTEQQRLLRTDPVYGGITATTFPRDADTINTELAAQQAWDKQRTALTSGAVPLTAADQAALDKVRSELERNDTLWVDYNDGTVLAEGAIPGGWGSVRWQVSMVSDEPRYDLAVAPPGAGPDWTFPGGAETDIRVVDLRKLAALLTKAGTTPVSAAEGKDTEPMSRAQQIRDAWNNSGAPMSQWVQEARTDEAIVVDDTDRTYRRIPVTFDGDTVVFGLPEPYDPAADRVLVFASRAESRPEASSAPNPTAEATPVADPASPVLPAAEPEQVIIPDPKEGLVPTDLSVFRSRLGLPDDADDAAITVAIEERLAKAETPVVPTPEMVAASAAAESEKDELRKEVQVLASTVTLMSARLAEEQAAKAATVKASVFESAIKDGKITPADREQWETDYDQAPGAVTRVLASIAVGTAVPVLASGVAGSPDPTGTDAEFDAMVARIDGPHAKVV